MRRKKSALAAMFIVGCGSGSAQNHSAPPASDDAGSSDARATTGRDASAQDAARPTFRPIRIACGQTSPVTDSSGNVWSADEDYAGGTALLTADHAVAGTSSPDLYDGQRYGDSGTAFKYVIPVPAGRYLVRLHFTEGYFATGGRVFDVSLDGIKVLQNFDIYAEAGSAWKAVDHAFAVSVASAPAITLTFDPVVQDPLINAIEIDEAGGDAGSTDAAPPSGDATPPTTDLLSYMKGLNTGTSARVLSGQHADYWQQSNSDTYGEQLDEFTGTTPATITITTTGDTPAILGTTFDLEYQNVTSAQDLALVNGWLAAGGIAQVSYWPIDPAGDGNNPFPDILTGGTTINAAWMTELASLASQLKAVSGTVLFRPLLEMNGNWFWWGTENRSSAQFIQLWQAMHDYLVTKEGLENLLWVYSVNANMGSDTSYTENYPGSSYVDVVAFDYYGDNPATDCLSTYQTLATYGQPIIISEGGVGGPSTQPLDSGDNSQFIQAVKGSMPNIVAVVIWGQGWALSKQNGASAFMTDPWIVNRPGLPKGL
jgi:mannan endo-1,4-beta-mannosidase